MKLALIFLLMAVGCQKPQYVGIAMVGTIRKHVSPEETVWERKTDQLTCAAIFHHPNVPAWPASYAATILEDPDRLEHWFETESEAETFVKEWCKP